MIAYILELIVATILGQTLVASISAWEAQRKNSNLDAFKAIFVYFKHESAKFLMIVIATLCLMFILPLVMDMEMTRKELILKEGTLTIVEKIQKNFRLYALLWGVFVELVVLVFYRGGRKAVQDYGKSKGVQTDDL